MNDAPAGLGPQVRATIARLQLSGLVNAVAHPLGSITHVQCPRCFEHRGASLRYLAAVNGTIWLYYCYAVIDPSWPSGDCPGWRGLVWYLQGAAINGELHKLYVAEMPRQQCWDDYPELEDV